MSEHGRTEPLRPILIAGMIIAPYLALALDLSLRSFHRGEMYWGFEVYGYLAVAGVLLGIMRALWLGWLRRSALWAIVGSLGFGILYFGGGFALVLLVRPFQIYPDLFFTNMGIYLFSLAWFAPGDGLLAFLILKFGGRTAETPA